MSTPPTPQNDKTPKRPNAQTTKLIINDVMSKLLVS